MGPGWFLILGALVTASAAWFLVVSVRSFRLGLQSRHWPTVSGVVTDSQAKEGDESWRFHVEYRYEVDGLSHLGDKLEATTSTYNRDKAYALEDRYQVGTEVEVHYDPANPSKSVLVPGAGAAWLGVLITLAVAGFGIWMGANAIGRMVEPSSSDAEPTVASSFNDPTGIAVASDGTVYVCDGAPKQASTAQFPAPGFPGMSTTTAPFPGLPGQTSGPTGGRVLRLSSDLLGFSNAVPWTLHAPTGLAFDKAGKMYVTDSGGGDFPYLGRLWVITEERRPNEPDKRRLTGATPLSNLFSPGGVAVDSAGTIYITERSTGVVLRLAAGDTKATQFFKAPEGGSSADVAIDSSDNVYVTDDRKNRVLKFAPGGGDPVVLPFGDLSGPQGVTVDTGGNVYVVDSGHHRVLKLAAGEHNPVELPFKELKTPYDVAVDNAGTVYVTDRGYRRVMKSSPIP